MKLSFRWYGESDPISLEYIRQIPGMRSIVTAVYDVKPGQVWPEESLAKLKQDCDNNGLVFDVVESIPVHEDIKLGLPSRDQYIENYKTTIRNLAQYGVKVIVYNFMPVLDWLRTDLARLIPEDGSNRLYYDEEELGSMTPLEIVRRTAEGSNGFSLPGWEPERLAELEHTLKLYESVDAEKLLENYGYFLQEIIPVCEEVGVRMACHPDDPAWPIFGLPRIAHTKEGLDKIVSLYDSPANALCVCTGSLGSNVENDVPAILRYFGEKGRVAAVHVRNIKHLGAPRRFRESAHLSSEGDLDMYAIMKTIHDVCPDVYIRPDHGRMIWGETGRPGYGLYDRALGACYLNGLWEAIEKSC